MENPLAAGAQGASPAGTAGTSVTGGQGLADDAQGREEVNNTKKVGIAGGPARPAGALGRPILPSSVCSGTMGASAPSKGPAAISSWRIPRPL